MKKRYKPLWLILSIVITLIVIGVYIKVNRSTTDKFIKLLENDEEDEDDYKLNMMIYSGLSSSYISLGNIEESERYFLKAKSIALTGNMKQELGELYYARGKANMRVKDNDKQVINYFKEAEKYLDNPKSQIRNKIMLSVVYKLNGDVDLSLNYTEEALN